MQDKKPPTPDQLIEQLIMKLSSHDQIDRAQAARELCNLGKKVMEARSALLALHNDPWYQVRIQVPRAIIHMEIPPDQAAEILTRLLGDENEVVRSYAVEAQQVLLQRTSEPRSCSPASGSKDLTESR